ncbi:hypothetical protein MPER_07868, partial [Moniliophthora perniciosa FA553]
NYTQERQDSLKRYTGDSIPPSKVFRCQSHSFFDILNAGIRVFDLRFAWNPTNDTVGTSTPCTSNSYRRCFFGFYSWKISNKTKGIKRMLMGGR